MMDSEEDLEFLETLKVEFYGEAQEGLEGCEALLLEFNSSSETGKLDEFMRVLHSMKGSARAVDMEEIAKVFHSLESVCLRIKDAGAGDINPMLSIIDKLREYISMFENEQADEAAPIVEQCLTELESM